MRTGQQCLTCGIADPTKCLCLDVLFDGPPGPEAGRFVEVEDATGKSVNAGPWTERKDGLWTLRIPGLSGLSDALDAARAELAQVKQEREMLRRFAADVESLLGAHREAWIHDDCEDDCRACEYEHLYGNARAALDGTKEKA